MGLALSFSVCKFELHVRCINCHGETVREFSVPSDQAPMDVDDLLMSEAINRRPYICRRCDGTIGQIFGVRRV